jgi:hypothetical protein
VVALGPQEIYKTHVSGIENTQHPLAKLEASKGYPCTKAMAGLLTSFIAVVSIAATAAIAVPPSCAPFTILNRTGLMDKASTLAHFLNTSYPECCAKCTERTECTAWTHHGGETNDCYITATISPHAPGSQKNTISGYKGSLRPTPKPTPRKRTPPLTPAPPTPALGKFSNIVFGAN